MVLSHSVRNITNHFTNNIICSRILICTHITVSSCESLPLSIISEYQAGVLALVYSFVFVHKSGRRTRRTRGMVMVRNQRISSRISRAQALSPLEFFKVPSNGTRIITIYSYNFISRHCFSQNSKTCGVVLSSVGWNQNFLIYN